LIQKLCVSWKLKPTNDDVSSALRAKTARSQGKGSGRKGSRDIVNNYVTGKER
jgi:hypothetical protein